MARTQHLPIYQAVFIYTREMYRLRAGFPKSIKHDLGQEICESSIKLLKCVVIANGAIQKGRHLTRLLLEIEVQWALLRLLYNAAFFRKSSSSSTRGNRMTRPSLQLSSMAEQGDGPSAFGLSPG
ncbi:MAG: hypothetical protein IT285_12455, partial [Bdellovibrionales bacterium]|nr:hypothetical protein [Bdellovibrionales bacterium]